MKIESSAVPPAPDSMTAFDDPEKGLMDYLLPLWRGRWVILACTVAFGGGVWAWTRTIPRTYEATATLMVSLSKMGPGNVTNPTLQVVYSMAMLMRNQKLGAEVMKEFGLDHPPYNLTPAYFLDSHVSVQDVRNTNLIQAKVRLSDPLLAAGVANRFAERAVALSARLIQDEATQVRDFIKRQLDDAQMTTARLESQALERRREAPTEVLRKTVDAGLILRERLPTLLVELEGAKARLAAAESEILNHQKTVTLKRAVDLEPDSLEIVRQIGDGRLLGVAVGSEMMNPVYKELEERIATERMAVADLKTQCEKIQAALRGNDGVVASLHRLYQSEAEMAKLEASLALSRRVYSDLAQRYEQARMDIAARSTELLLVDPAVPPRAPIGPRSRFLVVIAVMAGFSISAAVCLVLPLISLGSKRSVAKSETLSV